MSDDVADTLEEIGRYLSAEGSPMAHSYSRAANAVREADIIPANPAELDGVGEAMREDIETIRVGGSHPKLERLREKHPYLDDLTRVKGVGPKTASKIHDALGVDTVDELLEESDRLTIIYGIGDKKASRIISNAKDVR